MTSREKKLKSRREFTSKLQERRNNYLKLVEAKQVKDNARDLYYKTLAEHKASALPKPQPVNIVLEETSIGEV